ncbi:TetR/AcrR family transcriptional regulator [Palleronia caenipelagi]|uniref:TetR/AcrR family transcriptional regulator n=1 Tax=Palleronia caenipelagi TaxID=2489174 RepID=A0A547PNR1_9RHOB|nr:TetR/AcrR family transcriptional regulator [Palleronia caenipelagi]TRD15787.1 TetR/AcrR family transcriptional regulator [Palleronia caenipelagi]
MSDKRESRKAELRGRLLDAAEAQIAREGLASLKAREVTREAGCALGALYNVFEDLDRLVLDVNLRTLSRLKVMLAEACEAADPTPRAQLEALATVYAEFALGEPQLWQALFNHRVPMEVITDVYRTEHAPLIELIVPPLGILRPDLTGANLVQRARTLFSAVHGVVHLSLLGRVVGVPQEMLVEEVRALVQTLTKEPVA